MNKIIFVFFFLCALIIKGQTISGTIESASGKTLVRANILIKEVNDVENVKEFVITQSENFSITLKKDYKTILIEAISIGFYSETYTIENPLKDKTYNI